jgi:hypothetical protein
MPKVPGNVQNKLHPTVIPLAPRKLDDVLSAFAPLLSEAIALRANLHAFLQSSSSVSPATLRSSRPSLPSGDVRGGRTTCVSHDRIDRKLSTLAFSATAGALELRL